MPTPRTILAALLALLVGAAMLLAAPATADHSGDGKFLFRGAIDEDGDGHSENFALDITYDRDLLGDTHTLDAEAGWVDGDRQGYNCAYAFLRYRGFLVGRVTIRKFRDPDDPQNSYVEVIDKHMHEGALNFDGTTPLEANRDGDGSGTVDSGKGCGSKSVFPNGGVASEDYEPLTGAGEHPVVTFQHGPHAIDVRDFADELDVNVKDPTVVFDLVSATPTQVVIVAYQDNGALPFLSIYYELVPDPEQGLSVGETTPGTQHHVSLHTGCGLECVHSHEPDPTEDPEPTTDPDPTEEPDPTTDPEPEPLLGDLDGDGKVNITDLTILVNNWTG